MYKQYKVADIAKSRRQLNISRLIRNDNTDEIQFWLLKFIFLY